MDHHHYYSPPAVTTPPPLTPREFARAMKLSDQTVRRMIHSGELECFTVRGRFRIPYAEFLRISNGGGARITSS